DSDSPDEMSSPEHISPLPATSPFICTDPSETPDSSDGPPSQDPYVATVARWRSRVTARPSSSSEFPIAPVTAPPRIRRREAFRRWCAAPLSTWYPPTTSESSSGDSSERPLHSSSHSAGPSRKRCRSPVDSVPSSMPVMGSLAPTRADLLPPRKRFRDSYSSEASIEEDTKIDPIETVVDMELGIGEGDDVRDHVEIDPRDVRDDTEEYEADTSAGDTVEVGIDPMSTPIVEEEIVEPAGEDPSDSSGTRDGIVSLRLENLKVRAMLDIERDRVNSLRLHMSLSQEEFCQVRRDRDDTRGRLRRTMTNTRSGMTPAAIEEMINQRVDAALEARRVNRDLELGNGNDNGGGDGNGNGNGNGRVILCLMNNQSFISFGVMPSTPPPIS
ncbi:hypothetical protein Tco_1211610, partial [Tanacetum coccineum]